jgi:CDP-diacylglycerol---glycerol-3-phosphate 3-phosphatidyltransferase
MANFLKEFGQPIVYKIIQPLIVWLHRMGISPNMVTTAGFILNIGVAILLIKGAIQQPIDLRYLGWAGILILFAGLFDMIDGRLARVSGQSSQFGALYDSVLDRYSELFIFLGLSYFLSAHHYFYSSIVTFMAMIGSIMVSYVRARAEGLGIACSDGLMQRPERILLIGISAIVCGFSQYFFGNFAWQSASGYLRFENISLISVPILLLAILANYTAWQRLEHCRRLLSDQSNQS